NPAGPTKSPLVLNEGAFLINTIPPTKHEDIGLIISIGVYQKQNTLTNYLFVSEWKPIDKI
ncbi:MAG: hypothetical protein ACO29Q_09640, partial [Crocinitomicaceae bacterium]